MDKKQKEQEVTTKEALIELINSTPEGTMITIEPEEGEIKDDGDDT